MKLRRATTFRPAFVLFIPALNLVLLLVFFLLLSTSFLLQPGVAVTPPSSRFLLPPLQNPLVVAVTGGPGAAVYFEDHAVDLDQLEVRLARLQRESRHLVIKADRDAPYRLVSSVMELSLRMGFQVALAGEEAP